MHCVLHNTLFDVRCRFNVSLLVFHLKIMVTKPENWSNCVIRKLRCAQAAAYSVTVINSRHITMHIWRLSKDLGCMAMRWTLKFLLKSTRY